MNFQLVVVLVAASCVPNLLCAPTTDIPKDPTVKPPEATPIVAPKDVTPATPVSNPISDPGIPANPINAPLPGTLNGDPSNATASPRSLGYGYPYTGSYIPSYNYPSYSYPSYVYPSYTYPSYYVPVYYTQPTYYYYYPQNSSASAASAAAASASGGSVSAAAAAANGK